MTEGHHFRLELFSRGGDPRSPTGRVFEYPCPGLPADARVFGVIEATSPDTASTIASLVRNAMLSAETLEKRTLQSGLEGKFEAILLALNRGYAELAANGTVPAEPLPHVLIGMLVGGELFLSGRGDVSAWMFRPSDGRDPRALFGDGETTRETHVLFRTIVSGTLRPNDVVLISVSSLFDYLAMPHLSRVVTAMPAAQARTRILELLGDIESTVCISGILIGTSLPTAKRPPVVAAPTHATDDQEEPGAGRRGIMKRPHAVIGGTRMVAAASGKAATALARALGAAWRATRAAWRAVSSRDARREVPDRLIARWNGLPRRKRLLVVALAVAVLLFGESLRWLAAARSRDAAVLAYNGAVASVREKRDAAEASMIYKDEARAWLQLGEADDAVRALPAGTEQERKTVEELLAQIETDREKLRHVTSLADATPVTEIPADGGIGASIYSGKTLVTVVSDTGGAWNWSKDKKTLTQAIAPFLADGVVHRAFVGTRSPLYVTATSVAERIATSTVRATMQLPAAGTVEAAAIWSGRLYALVPEANQVYRGSKSGDAWTVKTPALTAPDVADAQDIAIDGEVWVAKPQSVKRYLKGEERAFALAPFDPAPKKFTRIWVTQATDLLALYDGEAKRLYLFDKDGKFLAQYVHGPVDDLRDVALERDALWLLTTTGLYRADVPKQDAN